MDSIVTFGVLAAFCLAAVVWDLHAGRVPNILNLAGFAAGITTGLLTGGAGRLADCLLGSLLGVGILLIPFLVKMVGAGDVKFLGAAGAITGWRVLGISFLTGAAIGAFIGLVLIITRFRSREDIFSWLAPLFMPGSLGRFAAVRSQKEGMGMRLPYAVPLSLGLMLCTGLKLWW